MKKIIYILFTIFLTTMFSFIGHALLEVVIIKKALAESEPIIGTFFLGLGWCALPVWSQYTFLASGLIGGYFLGQYWWKVVYVQKRYWSFKRDKNKDKKLKKLKK